MKNNMVMLPQLKRSTHPKRQPKRCSPNFLTSLTLLTDDDEPSSFQDARKFEVANNERKQWMKK